MKKINNKGVSAVIGVILMVAITVAIAGTVFVYVSQLETNNLAKEGTYKGNLTKLEFKHDDIFLLTLDSKNITVRVSDVNALVVGNYYLITVDGNGNISRVVEIVES